MTDPDGLGQMPGPSLLDALLADAQAVFGQYLMLEADLVRIQQSLLHAEPLAQAKNQGALLEELRISYRGSVDVLSRYRATKTTLTTAITQIQKAKADFDAGRVGWAQIIALSLALAGTLPSALNTARQLLVDVPRFTQQTAALVERVNAAPSLAPSVSFTQAFGLQNLTQALPWIVGGLAIVYFVPRLMPERRRA